MEAQFEISLMGHRSSIDSSLPAVSQGGRVSGIVMLLPTDTKGKDGALIRASERFFSLR